MPVKYFKKLPVDEISVSPSDYMPEVVIVANNEYIYVQTKDVPAFVEAVQKAAVEADKTAAAVDAKLRSQNRPALANMNAKKEVK